MAILKTSGRIGKLESLYIHTSKTDPITSEPCSSARASFAGLEGDSHNGLVRDSCGRVRRQYTVGTTIRNVRQISIVSVEELQTIATGMNIPSISAAWLGANLCLQGIEDFTQVPPSSRLIFSSGVSLVVDMTNEPCKGPADVIDTKYPGQGKHFVKHAMDLRGVTAWVECEGELAVGDKVEVHVPMQKIWSLPAS